jgi:hypothetical protein
VLILICVLSVLLLISLVLNTYQFFKRKKTKTTRSEELADFLADYQTHGFGFVRVDPDSVLLRSPRR